MRQWFFEVSKWRRHLAQIDRDRSFQCSTRCQDVPTIVREGPQFNSIAVSAQHQMQFFPANCRGISTEGKAIQRIVAEFASGKIQQESGGEWTMHD